MGPISAQRLGGLSLIFGPLLSFLFFTLQPGGRLIAPAQLSDPGGYITSLASNAGLSYVTAIVVALSLIVTIYGLYVLVAGLSARDDGNGLAQAGFALILFGIFGWAIAQGLVLVLANAKSPESMQAMVAVFHARTGIVLICGLAIALGFAVFGLAIASSAGFNKSAALIAAALSAVVFVTYLIGIVDPSQLDSMISIARIFYLAWVIWPIILGLGLLKAGNR